MHEQLPSQHLITSALPPPTLQ